MKRRRPPPKLTAVDLFCGAGGTSTGLAMACKEIGISKVDLLAVNHWPIAVKTHSDNHPWAKHLCESIERINPTKAVPSGRLKLLVASPECTNHSIARGGRPVNEQSRATAWHVLKWAQELYIDNILIENVREFRQWGPIGADGKPLKSMKGQTYRQFLAALESLGYRVEERLLNAADFGDATTRERLFILARRPAHKKVRWPDPSHTKNEASKDLFATLKPWRPAKEIIDWSIPGQSIFTRKKPLAKATIERIAAGLRRLPPAIAEPFLVVLQNHCTAKSVNGPVPAFTAQGNKVGLCQPFVVRMDQLNGNGDLEAFVLQQQSGGAPRSTKQPLPTVASKGAIGLVQPIIITPGGPNLRNGRSVEKPLPTVTCKDRLAVVQPQAFVLPPLGIGRGNATRPVDQPIQTILASRGGGHLVQPQAFMVPFFGEREGQEPRTHSVENPLPAVTSHGAGALVQPQVYKADPFIMPLNHGSGDNRSYAVDKPMPTITSVDAWALIGAHLVKYYGSAKGAQSVEEPVDTITSRDRLGLVQPLIQEKRSKAKKNGNKHKTKKNGQPEQVVFVVDILFRMLQPHELAAAMGFPKEYKFSGNREEQVKQIGNAVCVQTAKALCKALLED